MFRDLARDEAMVRHCVAPSTPRQRLVYRGLMGEAKELHHWQTLVASSTHVSPLGATTPSTRCLPSRLAVSRNLIELAIGGVEPCQPFSAATKGVDTNDVAAVEHLARLL